MVAHEQDSEAKKKICDPIRNLYNAPAFDHNNTEVNSEKCFFPARKKRKENNQRDKKQCTNC